MLPLLCLLATFAGSGVVEDGFRFSRLTLVSLPGELGGDHLPIVTDGMPPLQAAVASTWPTPADERVVPMAAVEEGRLPKGATLVPLLSAIAAGGVSQDRELAPRAVVREEIAPAGRVRTASLDEDHAAAFLSVRAAQSGRRPAYEAARCFRGESGSIDASMFVSRRMLSAVSLVRPRAPTEAGTFGQAIADAAMAQTKRFTVYNGRYFPISFPGGDIPELYGVCTDVVVRAYRAVGIDLQLELRQAGITSGGPAIAHRRTVNLKRFFSQAGAELPVSEFGEDYAPGDIVTYDRPQNAGSRYHIAVVSDVIGPSGDPMIIHNRGWGPQLEDSLFVDRITGHYRYRGPASADAGHVADAGSPLERAASGRGSLPRFASSARGPVLPRKSTQ